MALSPLTTVPITWQNSLVDVHPTSQYRKGPDRALVSTVLQLQATAGTTASFILPAERDVVAAPLLRFIDDDDAESVAFVPTEADPIDKQLTQALGVAAEPDRELWEAVKVSADRFFTASVKLKQPNPLVRFTQRLKVPQGSDGVFELQVLAPLASYVIAVGGSISFAVALPRIPGRAVTIQQATAENPPGTPIGEISERVSLGQRSFVAHFWQHDPLYRIRYSYN